MFIRPYLSAVRAAVGRGPGGGCVDGAGDGVVPVVSANIHHSTEEHREQIDWQGGLWR